MPDHAHHRTATEDRRFDEAIQRAEYLRERALAHGFRGHVASAQRDLGRAHAALGREEKSLESLREAVNLRRLLSDEEVREQSVTSLLAFLDALGVAARQFGHYDEAFRSFLETLEANTRKGDRHFQALALSEIGYTYQQSGDYANALHFLTQAAEVEARDGQTADSRRWSLQAKTLAKGVIQQFEVSPNDPRGGLVAPADLTVRDDPSAYLLAEQALQLAANGKHEDAIRAVSAALPWFLSRKDFNSQVTCRNVLGICYGHLGRTQEAVKEFQRGIQLADRGGGGASGSLVLRYNLAKLFLTVGYYTPCDDVLLAGLAYSEVILSRTDSFATRQQIVSLSLPLYELYVLLFSQVDAGPNHDRLLAITEVVRARNTATWARTQGEFEWANGSQADAVWVDHQLRQLRAVEVELDLRHMTNALSSSDATALQERARALREELRQKLGEVRTPWDISFSHVGGEEHAEIKELLEAILTPGSAALLLFSIPEGVAPVVYYRDDHGLKSAGSFIEWAREERVEAVSMWAGRAALLRSRAARPRDLEPDGSTSHDGNPERLLDGLLTLTQERLFEGLRGLLAQYNPRRLVVFPHRELALLPYWRLADQCPSLGSVVLAPSLAMMRVCVGRRRELRGNTCVVTDVTGTLSQVALEADTVRAARGAVEVVTSVDRLVEGGTNCNLLHVAGHGTFNPKNPYYSGFLLERSEAAAGLFVQYAQPVIAGSGSSFEFTGQSRPGNFRLMTVAECLGRLSLGVCRLAVLSACECGVADTHGGGELTGLPTSLLVAGAKSVIAPLWPVDDTATALLMAYFYENWQGGTGNNPSPADSLAEARCRLRQSTRDEIRNRFGSHVGLPPGDRPYAHPLFTDAFHCFGDW